MDKNIKLFLLLITILYLINLFIAFSIKKDINNITTTMNEWEVVE